MNKNWQKIQQHEADIRRILTELKCMDNKGHIRAWKPTVVPALNAAGHTSLDPHECKCAHAA